MPTDDRLRARRMRVDMDMMQERAWVLLALSPAPDK
jgi:hypothetical protein